MSEKMGERACEVLQRESVLLVMCERRASDREQRSASVLGLLPVRPGPPCFKAPPPPAPHTAPGQVVSHLVSTGGWGGLSFPFFFFSLIFHLCLSPAHKGPLPLLFFFFFTLLLCNQPFMASLRGMDASPVLSVFRPPFRPHCCCLSANV